MRHIPRPRVTAVAIAATASCIAIGLPGAVAHATGESGGSQLQVTCNQFTHGADGFTATEHFSGLVGGDSSTYGYQVDYTYTDSAGLETFKDDSSYWYALADGTYDHVYTFNFDIPSGTNVSYQLKAFHNGGEIDDIVDGVSAVSGSCSTKPPKPNEPTVDPATIQVSKKGKFDVTLDVDAHTHGSVTLSNGSGQLTSGGYPTTAKTSVDIKLDLGKADLKHLKKVGHEDVKAQATSINASGSTKSKTVVELKAPKK